MSRKKKLTHQEYVERYRPDSLITQYEEEIQRLCAVVKIYRKALEAISERDDDDCLNFITADIAKDALDSVLDKQRTKDQ